MGKLSSSSVSVICAYEDLIDGVICINMDVAAHRWKGYCARAEGVIAPEKLHRLEAVKGAQLPGYGEKPWFTKRTGERNGYWANVTGCMLSHRNAIRLAQEKGWRNVLIMEDDAVPELTTEGCQALRRALMEMRGKWMFYLGYTELPRPWGSMLWQQGGYSLWQIDGALATHAYIVPQSLYADILASLPQQDDQAWSWMAHHRAIDNWYRNEVSNWRGVRIYALMPVDCKIKCNR